MWGWTGRRRATLTLADDPTRNTCVALKSSSVRSARCTAKLANSGTCSPMAAFHPRPFPFVFRSGPSCSEKSGSPVRHAARWRMRSFTSERRRFSRRHQPCLTVTTTRTIARVQPSMLCTVVSALEGSPRKTGRMGRSIVESTTAEVGKTRVGRTACFPAHLTLLMPEHCSISIPPVGNAML